MLLNSIVFLLLIISIFINNLKILIFITFLLILTNIFFNNKLKNHLKSVKILLFFYVTTFLVQIFYNQEGKVIFKIYSIYITENGLINFLTNFLRILNLILISWIVSSRNIFKGRFSKYQRVIETVIDLVPEVFSLFKKKVKLKYFFRHILRQIRLKYESL